MPTRGRSGEVSYNYRHGLGLWLVPRRSGGADILPSAGAFGNVMADPIPDDVMHLPQREDDERATQAIGILVERLDFKEPEHFEHISTTTRSPLRNHYALFALIQIGEPSIPAVLRKALDTDDMMMHIYAAGLTDKIKGTDMAVVYLQKLLEKETDKKKQARLQDIVKHVLRGPDSDL